MTPEEQKRINDRFDRIEALLLGMATESTARFADHEVWFKRFENDLAETLSASNARFVRIEANLEQVAAGQAKHDATLDRIDRVVEFLANAQAHLTSNIAELEKIVRRHVKDGHGGEEEEEEL